MSNILIIVEGNKTEPNLFNKYFKELKNTYPDICKSDIDIISYSSNIYSLYNIIKKYEEDGIIYTNTLDILKEINEKNPTPELEEVLKYDYSEIYLMFDLEYQDYLYNKEDKYKILNKMLNLFNNETENGLLFINYPMIESYRHWKNKDQIIDEFKDKIILCSKAKQYKKDLNVIGSIYDINKYTFDMFKDITKANVMKASYLVNNSYVFPSYKDFRSFVDGKDILKHEFKFINEGNIFVLCTSMFIFLNYYGEKLYRKLEE